MTAPIGRRSALALGAGGLLSAGSASSAPPPARDDASASTRPLKWHAARKGLSFGIGVWDRQISTDRALARAVAAEADMVVPAIEMKWGETDKVRGHPDYTAAEDIAAFAKANGLRLRGHTAAWYRNVPAWAQPLLHTPEGPRLVLERAHAVVRHFRGRVFEWDVLNEAIEPHDELPGLLRKEPFGRPMSVGYIADLFEAAHDADPDARLFYNDNTVEGMLPYEVQKRPAVLALLTELRKRGAPIHGFGIQSHLATHLRFEPAPFRHFIAEVAALGLDIRLTEFDVTDRTTPGTIEQRDRQIADLAQSYLDTAFDEKAVKGLLSWGLRDKDIDVPPKMRRPDGLEMRLLPLDDNLNRKPLWNAIARAFDGAPAR